MTSAEFLFLFKYKSEQLVFVSEICLSLHDFFVQIKVSSEVTDVIPKLALGNFISLTFSVDPQGTIKVTHTKLHKLPSRRVGISYMYLYQLAEQEGFITQLPYTFQLW